MAQRGVQKEITEQHEVKHNDEEREDQCPRGCVVNFNRLPCLLLRLFALNNHLFFCGNATIFEEVREEENDVDCTE
jgi:hypothetical protein